MDRNFQKFIHKRSDSSDYLILTKNEKSLIKNFVNDNIELLSKYSQNRLKRKSIENRKPPLQNIGKK